MKTEFEEPVVDIIYFDAEDIIVTSSGKCGAGGTDETYDQIAT